MPSKKKRRRSKYPAHFKGRVDALRERIHDWGAGGLLVSNPADIRYLTGFRGEDSWAIITANSNKPYILSDSRFEQDIPAASPQSTVLMRKPGVRLSDLTKRIVGQRRIKKLAIQSAHLTVAQRKALAKAITARKIKDVDDGLIEQRAVKDPSEVKLIGRAVKIQQDAFRRTCRYIKPGKAESDIAGYLEYQMRALGADGAGFPSIVGADANASIPHYVPAGAKVKKGGIVLIDWGAIYQGYRSDMTRVVAIGRWPRKMKQIYQVVLEAQLTAIDKIAPGVPLVDVDKAARNVIKKAGYAKRFRHGLGHGLGIDIHESPRLGEKVKGELAPGQVVTVEPGIYLPGVGGVRIEDDVLVTAKGHRLLCDLPKDLESAII